MKERFDKLNELWASLNSSRKISLVVALLGILTLQVSLSCHGPVVALQCALS